MLWASLQLPGDAGVQKPVIIRFGDTEATCLSESTAAAAFPWSSEVWLWFCLTV